MPQHEAPAFPERLLHAGAVASVRREKYRGGGIYLRLPEPWVEALGTLAAEQGLTLVELVRCCLEIGLGLPDGAMSRACAHTTAESRARYRALATEAARRAAYADACAIVEAHTARSRKIARDARAEALERDGRIPPPAVETLHARRTRVTATELLAEVQIAAAETASDRASAARERAAHQARRARA